MEHQNDPQANTQQVNPQASQQAIPNIGASDGLREMKEVDRSGKSSKTRFIKNPPKVELSPNSKKYFGYINLDELDEKFSEIFLNIFRTYETRDGKKVFPGDFLATEPWERRAEYEEKKAEGPERLEVLKVKRSIDYEANCLYFCMTTKLPYLRTPVDVFICVRPLPYVILDEPSREMLAPPPGKLQTSADIVPQLPKVVDCSFTAKSGKSYTTTQPLIENIIRVIDLQTKLQCIYEATGHLYPDVLMSNKMSPGVQRLSFENTVDGSRALKRMPQFQGIDIAFVPWKPMAAPSRDKAVNIWIDEKLKEGATLYGMAGLTPKGQNRVKLEREFGYPPYDRDSLFSVGLVFLHGIGYECAVCSTGKPFYEIECYSKQIHERYIEQSTKPVDDNMPLALRNAVDAVINVNREDLLLRYYVRADLSDTPEDDDDLEQDSMPAYLHTLYEADPEEVRRVFEERRKAFLDSQAANARKISEESIDTGFRIVAEDEASRL